MRPTLIVILALIAPAAAEPAETAPQSTLPPVMKVVIKNPKMDEGSSRPADWASDWTASGSVKITRDTAAYHSAPASLCMESVGGPATAQVAQMLDVKGGERLQLSAWLRAAGGANALFAVQSYTVDWKGIELKIIGNSVTGFDWKQVSGGVSLPPNAAHAGVQLMIQGPGKAWIDDVSADGSDPGAGAKPISAAVAAPPNGPPAPKNSCDPAEGFYPDYPNAWRLFVEDELKRTKEGGIPLLFLGDSLILGWREQPQWKAHYEKMGAVDYGVGGDGTPQVLWRIEHGILDGIQPRVVVLCIGVNNMWPGFDAADTIKGIQAVLTAIKAKCPQTKILLIGNTHLLDQGARERVRTINSAQAKMADGKRIRFLDFSERFLKDDGDLKAELYKPDRLHLQNEGYVIWAEAMDPVLDDMMK